LAHIGYGYGSEWHLLHELGRRRAAFTREVERVTHCSETQWLDNEETVDEKTGKLKVREPKGLEFLAPTDRARLEWERLWPQSGNVHNWDAVGRGQIAERTTWTLLEAKAHIGELSSSCTAKSPDSIRRIDAVLEETKRALGVPDAAAWAEGYYQYSNRLALLHFLTTHGVDAHLVFVYFLDDRTDIGRAGRECPASEPEWREALAAQDSHVALPSTSPLRERVHRLFVPVHRANIAVEVLKPEYYRAPLTLEPRATHMSSTELAGAFDEAMRQIYFDAKAQTGVQRNEVLADAR